ncbi:hypothetical protein [Nonomuraea lactucae]|uniref:hypothetical protein n=1 Tax=Nonomuraea lactucae TaxID=2249762 RepID=UPI0013B3E414|nr:hypothetical protein [Nonomuraea lactucae]
MVAPSSLVGRRLPSPLVGRRRLGLARRLVVVTDQLTNRKPVARGSLSLAHRRF